MMAAGRPSPKESTVSKFEQLVAQSHELAAMLKASVDFPPYEGDEGNRKRFQISDVLCSIAFEHAHAARLLAAEGFLPSALAVHRSQFEALVRSMWVLYAATENHLDKLDADLSVESELAARNIPSASQMMDDLAKRAPANAYKPIGDFKASGWLTLNSYVHAGIHPIKRHQEGYPVALLAKVFQNINALDVVTAMQAAILTGVPDLQRQVLQVAERYPLCLIPVRG